MGKVFNNENGEIKRLLLRQNSTKSEDALWKYLKNRQLDGFKFRRQVGIGPYIVDLQIIKY